MNRFIIFILSIFVIQIASANDIDNRLKLAADLYYSHPDSSFQICCSVQDELKNSSDKIRIAEAQLCKGRYYILKTDLEKATTELNQAIRVFESENKLSKLAKCYSLKSIIFQRLNDDEKSMNHLTIALNLYIKDNNTNGQISSLTNISLEHLRFNRNDSALIYLNQLKALESEINNTGKYYYHQNFGKYYHNIGQYQKALYEYNLALSVAEKENMVDSKTTINMEIASSYLALKNYTNAESYIYKSIAIASNNNLMHEANEAYLMLIELYESLGDYKKAYLTKVLNDSIEKKIYDIEKINKINEIETELAFSQKEKIIAEQKLEIKQEQLNTLQANSKVSRLIFFVILCLIVIVFVIIIFVRARKLSNKIKVQKLLLEEKNNEITDSITYAKRIQSAILPSSEYINKHLPNSFILYKPKAIVAGDFYWMHKMDDTIIIAAADCTGHGVPGALVSVVCSNALNQSLEKINSTQPSLILDKTRDLVKDRFETENNNVKDGMDIALCSINAKSKKMEFAGANNPLYIVRDNELIEIKGDKQHIGKHHKEADFLHHSIDLKQGDHIYLFSDGYADQFGGPKGKKFMYKQFKELLISINDKPLNQQKEILDSTFESWKGELEQIDDVCVIGIKI